MVAYRLNSFAVSYALDGWDSDSIQKFSVFPASLSASRAARATARGCPVSFAKLAEADLTKTNLTDWSEILTTVRSLRKIRLVLLGRKEY